MNESCHAQAVLSKTLQASDGSVRSRELQLIASRDQVCCSALQCVAVRCSVFQCVAVYCSVSQCVAVSLSARMHTSRVRHDSLVCVSGCADCKSAGAGLTAC